LPPRISEALPQLLITLERAPDRVDDLAVVCATVRRSFRADAGDISTGAAGDAREVGRLIVKGLGQSRSIEDRAAFLDVLGELLLIGAYGVDDVIAESERQQRS
jgi:hypothetical protein